MALFDDRRFLLSHINHSFITGDDTGICEVVMLDEDVFENQQQRCLRLFGKDDEKPDESLCPEAYDLDYESELFESEQGQSYDIASDLDYICHRRRSNTAQRLDRLKKDKINQSKTRTIVWQCDSPTNSHNDDKLLQDPSNNDSTNCVNEPNGIVTNRKSKSPPQKSALTRLLERFPSLPKNPFNEFAQFDGGMSEAVPVLKIMIFIATNSNHQQPKPDVGLIQQTDSNRALKEADTMIRTENHPAVPNNCNTDGAITNTDPSRVVNNGQPEPPKIIINNTSVTNSGPQFNLAQASSKTNSGPLEVVIVSTAKVQDLIGLTCWQYTNEGREPKLNPDINKYCLRIAEDNGEVDIDFPSLNPRDPLSKFNFPSLALTEKTNERVRTYNDQHPNGNIYGHQMTSVNTNVVTTSSVKINASGKIAALTRLIFRDAKLDANQ